MAKRLDWSKHNFNMKTDADIAAKYSTRPSQTWDADWYAENKHLLKETAEQKKQRDGIITFGKYKGKHLSQVPKSYLRWLTQEVNNQPVLIEQAKKLLTSKSK
jgi:hypothetical protein